MSNPISVPSSNRNYDLSREILELGVDKQLCSLARVCRSWRKVALSSAWLWTHIAVDIGYRRPTSESQKPQCEERYVKQLNELFIWLRLSKDKPLMLYLRIHGNKQLPSELVETVGRWKVLHLVREEISRMETVMPSILQDVLPGKAKMPQRL